MCNMRMGRGYVDVLTSPGFSGFDEDAKVARFEAMIHRDGPLGDVMAGSSPET